MKIDKVIFSSDDSEYLKFWKLNSEITLKILNATPVLFHITDEDSDFFEDEFGIVKKIKKLTNHSTSVQSQIVRMYGTKYFPNEVCLTNDIDMFLFNKEYIESKLNSINDDDMVIFNSDGYDSKRPECLGEYSGPDRYPICYVSAKGITFDKILGTNTSFQDYMDKVQSIGLNGSNDEVYFGRRVNNQKDVIVHKIKRGISSNFYTPGRIEKYMFDFNDGGFSINLNGHINIDSFVDCHCKSPFSKYETLIYKIKNLILNNYINKINTKND